MNIQKLIIYKFEKLYHILNELQEHLNINIVEITNESNLILEIKKSSNFLILTKKYELNITNQIIINNFPIKISKLIEMINISFLKQKFNNQSQFVVKNYIVDLNSRQMLNKKAKLKLTEKEVNTIIYLSKNNEPISVNELQTAVWGYQSDIETHTVETHIYRLRKKISNTFDDKNFLVSKKKGYFISTS